MKRGKSSRGHSHVAEKGIPDTGAQSGLSRPESSSELLHFLCFALHFHALARTVHPSAARGRGPSVARKSSATSPVDESGPSNRDLLWKVSSSRLTGKRRFRRRIKLMVHPRGAPCTPAALLLFMPAHFPERVGKTTEPGPRRSKAPALKSRS